MKALLLLLIPSVAFAQPTPPPDEPAPPAQGDTAEKPLPPPLTQDGPASLAAPSTTNTVGPTESDPRKGLAVDVGDIHFAFHGYARMPLSAELTPRAPHLVDNDYYLSGFNYTRLYEPEWSELYLSASRGDYKVEFGLFASLYSDYATANLTNQLGIAQASVSAKNFLDTTGLTLQVGVFWDRFGYIEPYDTYIFGRTHQGGVKASYALPGGGRVQAGLGYHQAELDQNQGMTPIAHLAAAYPLGPIEVGAYALRTWTRDKPQLSSIQDGTMYVAGLDAKYKFPDNHGSAYLAFGYYDMDHALYLAPALEVLHSTGGRGIAENFLGTDSSDDGSGHMYTLAADVKGRLDDRLSARLFGIATWVRSPQVDEADASKNRDRRMYLKWGVEPAYRLTPRITAALRYDHVILDLYDRENSFRVVSPKISFPLDSWGEIFVMYSHYSYGDKIRLRAGQVQLETLPDSDVFKVQAQVVW